jgi:hypothetical protein
MALAQLAQRLALLPPGLERPLRHAGQFLADAAARRLEVVWLEGSLRVSGQPVRLLVAGEMPWSCYWPQHLLRPAFATRPIARVRVSSLPGVLDALRGQADFTWVRLAHGWSRWLAGSDYLRLPDWVNASVELPDDLKSFLRGNESRRSDARRLRNRGLRWSVSRSPEDLDEFYRDFHLPHLRRRYGELACLADPSSWQRRLAQGGLLWVLDPGQGQRLAGTLFFPEGDAFRLAVNGCRGDARLNLGLSASYVFTFSHAHALGYRRVNLGGCRPDTRDGLFRYKRKWGARFGEEATNCFDVLLWWRTPVVLSELLLSAAPVFRHGRSLAQLAARPPDTPPALSAMQKDLSAPGIGPLFVVGEARAGETVPPGVVLVEPGLAESSASLLAHIVRDRASAP